MLYPGTWGRERLPDLKKYVIVFWELEPNLNKRGDEMPRSKNVCTNIAAFLDTIAFSELGEKLIESSDDGYNVVVGGSLFYGYSDHPRILVDLPRLKIKSTAAGRYQLLARYFDAYKNQFPKFVNDFSPESQDYIAMRQITEQRAMNDVVAGRFDIAAEKVSNIWASFPGAGYGQHENKLEVLRDYFVSAGGVLS